MMKISKLALAMAIAALVYGFFAFDLGQYLSLDYLKSQQAAIEGYYQSYPWQIALIFFALYVAVTGLSLPGAAIMTLAAGAIFGLLWGSVIVSFASTIGATLAFLASRFLLRDTVQRVIKQVEPHDSVERYTQLGVEVIQGEARITSPYAVEVNGRTLTSRNIIIAAGARPFVPPIPGLEEAGYLTSDTIWNLRELPRRLVVLGGGPIGSELAQAFARFGSQVTQVEKGPRILVREDPEISERVKQRFEAEGIEVRTQTEAKSVQIEDGRKVLVCEHQDEAIRIEFDAILVAVGRVANTQGYGLEELGIPLTKTGTIEVNEYLQTRYPHIYAVGDVAGPFQFTHTAAHQAWYAAVNALFGAFRRFKVDYSIIPWATFTEPEVARVGLNEQEAREKGIPHEVTTFNIDDLDRAIADGEAHGLIKVLTVPGKNKILGVTIAGEHAGDLIAEYVTAMRHSLGLNKILSTIHIYPTLAEANKYVAGEWRRAHVSARALAWLERWHTWRRGRSMGRLIEQTETR